MLISSSPTVHPTVAAIIGYAVMVLGLAIAVLLVIALVKWLGRKLKKSDQAAVPAEIAEVAPIVSAEPRVAPGSAGKLKIHDVDPKTAAMLMAIVADQLQTPLNELRFISIKEVQS